MPLSPERIRAIAKLAEFDDVITAPLHGFHDAADYYQQCSGIKQLTQIRVPTQIIHAKDDPFMTEAVILISRYQQTSITVCLSMAAMWAF